MVMCVNCLLHKRHLFPSGIHMYANVDKEKDPTVEIVL